MHRISNLNMHKLSANFLLVFSSFSWLKENFKLIDMVLNFYLSLTSIYIFLIQFLHLQCGVNIMILLPFVDVQVKVIYRKYLSQICHHICWLYSLFIPHPDFGCICPKKKILRWKSVPLEREHTLLDKGASGWIMAHPWNSTNILERIKPGNAFLNIVYFFGKTAKKYSAFNI